MSDWNNFFASLRKYLDFFRAQIPGLNDLAIGVQTISDSELAGLISWTNLATAISLKDSESRLQICEERSWSCIESTTGLLASPIPLVLKGAFCKFLAALAVDEASTINIWNGLLSEGICVRQADGRLIGIQQDLDERECQLKIYDCTEGFLILLKELLSHKTRPNTQQISPYLQFIVGSVLCQFSTRSYEDANQMWRLVKLSLDSLYEPLKTFYATPATVENKVIEVQILVQLLSDSPLSRTLLQIIAEGAGRLQQDFPSMSPMQTEATGSAIRLLYTAISNQAALADAIRAVNSDLMVVTVESILFSPVPHPQQQSPHKYGSNYMSLLFQYISEADQLIRHTFYVWQILKEATAQRPSLQPRIIQSLRFRHGELADSIVALSIFSTEDISISVTDLPSTSNVDQLTHDRVKGEVCRLMFEVFNDAMEAAPAEPNVAYALMKFDMRDMQQPKGTEYQLSPTGSEGLTYLHNLIEIALQLSTADDPFCAQFSGLYEPALRLLLRLCSVRSSYSAIMLRFLRSQYDLCYGLAKSPIFQLLELPSSESAAFNNENGGAITTAAAQFSTNDTSSSTTILQNGRGGVFEKYALITVHKSIQGIILELMALELSALLRLGHIEQPHRYLRILLSSTSTENAVAAASASSSTFNLSATAGEQTERQPLLWLLLDSSRVFVEELSMPQCYKFDPQKVEELLSLCIRKNSCNIDQFDVLYLHLLLNSEINCIMNTEIGVIRQEARAILDFCVRKNARNLLEGACTHLLEGWLSLMNVLSIHAQQPIINTTVLQHLLVDALFLLRDYCASVEMSPELAASVAICISRLIRAICHLFAKYERPQSAREAILPILHLLLQCIVSPGYNKSVPFKMELYSACLRTLDLFTSGFQEKEQPSAGKLANGSAAAAGGKTVDLSLSTLLFDKVSQQQSPRSSSSSSNRNGTTTSTATTTTAGIGNIDDPMVAMMRHEQTITDLWAQLIGPHTQEVVNTLTSDIVFAPLALKILASATFVDLLREDCFFNGRMGKEFAMSGSLNCVDDTLARLQQHRKQQQQQHPSMMGGGGGGHEADYLIGALKSLVTLAAKHSRTFPLS